MFRQSLTIALLGTALTAATPVFDVTAGTSLALDGLKKVTHNSASYHLGGGMKWTAAATETPLRLGVTYQLMPGKDFGTVKSSLKAFQVHLDAYLATASPRYAFKFGVSANRFTVDNQGTESWIKDGRNPSGFSPEYVFALDDTKGVKLGLRFGVDIQLAKAWSAEVLFQATELGGGAVKPGNKPNLGGVNPSWIQVGARYSF